MNESLSHTIYIYILYQLKDWSKLFNWQANKEAPSKKQNEWYKSSKKRKTHFKHFLSQNLKKNKKTWRQCYWIAAWLVRIAADFQAYNSMLDQRKCLIISPALASSPLVLSNFRGDKLCTSILVNLLYKTSIKNLHIYKCRKIKPEHTRDWLELI